VALVLLLLLAGAGGLAAETRVTREDQPVSDAATQIDGERLELRVGASATVAGARARVHFVAVSDDSRCPIGVTCIWEGDALVQLRVEVEGEPDGHLELHANPRFGQQARAGALTVTLVRLEPLPQADRPVPPDAYAATLQISSK
jgi:hypothetical protein